MISHSMKRHNYIFTTASILLMSLCLTLSDLIAQETIDGSLTHDSIDRTYILYLPENYSENISYPLLLNFHGYGSNAFEQMWYGDFRPLADSEGFIIVHPNGTLDDTGTSHFNVGGWTTGSTADDVGFTSALLDDIISAYSIDENRIYSTGMSNGGYMSFLLACELSDRIAAIASVTGSMTPSTSENCDPQHPTPIMQIHGTEDLVVPYTGNSAWTLAIEDVLPYWTDFNECSETAESTILPDLDVNDGSTAELIKYKEGIQDVEVHHFKLDGAGHTWPGNFLGSNNTNYDIVGSTEIWNFLSQYDLATLTTVVNAIETESNEPEWSFILDSNDKTIKVTYLDELNAEYSIFNVNGKMFISGHLDSHMKISLGSIHTGTYFLKIGDRVRSFVINN